MSGRLRWTDLYEIVEALQVAHPTQDPQQLRFTDLHRWVCALADFGDDPKRCNEKILEALQALWIEENQVCE